jgi:hypothetical protein
MTGRSLVMLRWPLLYPLGMWFCHVASEFPGMVSGVMSLGMNTVLPTIVSDDSFRHTSLNLLCHVASEDHGIVHGVMSLGCYRSCYRSVLHGM